MALLSPQSILCGETLLRRFELGDIAPFTAFMTEPDNTRFMTFPDELKTDNAAAAIIRDTIASYGTPGPALALAICRADDPSMIGACGAHEAQSNELEIFCLILEPFRRGGHAARAVEGLIGHLRHQHTKTPLTAYVDPRNTPSKRILERLGFQDLGPMTVNGRTGRKFTREN